MMSPRRGWRLSVNELYITGVVILLVSALALVVASGAQNWSDDAGEHTVRHAVEASAVIEREESASSDPFIRAGVVDRMSDPPDGPQGDNRPSNNHSERERLRPLVSYPSPGVVGDEVIDQNDNMDSAIVDDELVVDFSEWCRHHLGIDSQVEVQTFEYDNFLYDIPVRIDSEDMWEDDDDWRDQQLPVNLPKIRVRGLAAARDIQHNDVILRIPLTALVSVATTIDQDPVLSTAMGREARRRYGWNASVLEIPLLAVALLYHRQLGIMSPIYPYLQLLSQTLVEDMPFLWKQPRRTMRPGVRRIARGLRWEVKNMYEGLVQHVLMRDFADLFANDAYSYENFAWAFAMVNTRHWQLPVADLETTIEVAQDSAVVDDEEIVQQSLPADVPTDQWVGDGAGHHRRPSALPVRTHSFLAPMADLLNFGPPCTRGKYDDETHVFEIVATCDFVKGQEITFYYGDECDDVMAAVYGFSHPMIPPCPTAEDYRLQAAEYKARAEILQNRLDEAYDEADAAEAELEHVHSLLSECDYCRYERRGEHEHVRGAKPQHVVDRHGGVRSASWRDVRSRAAEF